MNIYDTNENGSVKSENGYSKTEIVSPKILRPDTLDLNGSGEGEVKIKTRYIFDNNNKNGTSPLRGEKERFVYS